MKWTFKIACSRFFISEYDFFYISFKPLQCGEFHCWCVFLDAGYRIQTIDYVGRNETLVCPKLTLFGKDPCRMGPSPIVTCKNARGPRQKWIYDRMMKKCVLVETCAGFKTEYDCENACGKLFSGSA